MKTRYIYTNQKQLRKAFWETFPALEYTVINLAGSKKMCSAETKAVFEDWKTHLERDGLISEKLCFQATL